MADSGCLAVQCARWTIRCHLLRRGRIKAVLRAQSNEALEAIRNAASEATKNFDRGGTIELPMPAILASAVKPL